MAGLPGGVKHNKVKPDMKELRNPFHQIFHEWSLWSTLAGDPHIYQLRGRHTILNGSFSKEDIQVASTCTELVRQSEQDGSEVSPHNWWNGWGMVSAGGGEGGPHAFLGRVQTDAAVEDNGEEVPQGTGNRSFIWWSGSASGCVSEGNRNTTPEDVCTPICTDTGEP